MVPSAPVSATRLAPDQGPKAAGAFRYWVLTLPVVLFSCGPFFRSALRDLRARSIGMHAVDDDLRFPAPRGRIAVDRAAECRPFRRIVEHRLTVREHSLHPARLSLAWPASPDLNQALSLPNPMKKRLATHAARRPKK